MDTEELVLFNLFEAGLWFVVAIVLAIAWKKQSDRSASVSQGARTDSSHPTPARFSVPASIRPKSLLVAALIFVAFGCSDLVETQTGAWWNPWWLLLWKAACVHALLTVIILHRRQTRTQLPRPSRPRPPENLN